MHILKLKTDIWDASGVYDATMSTSRNRQNNESEVKPK